MLLNSIFICLKDICSEIGVKKLQGFTVFQNLTQMELSDIKSVKEHAKFLVFQLQQIFNVSILEQDCVVQCRDGSTVASCLVLAALSPPLAR